MIIKNMKITNVRGDSITFGRHFKLYEDIGLSELTAFDIPFFILKEIVDSWWIEQKRHEAYKTFNPKLNPFRIDFTTKSGEEYYVNANLEGAPSFPSGFDNDNKVWQKGLLQFSANDPYLYKKDAISVEVATWIGSFEFPLEIPEDGIEMGYRSPSLIVNVLNDGQETTGMMIRFKALGTLENPSLFNVNTREELKINFTMQGGDIIEISTYSRRKTIKLIRNGVETNIFNNLDLSSKFLQLDIGDNLFRYNADGGLDNLEVSINFTPRLLGV